ncbi:MAG TPA: PIN domain-containing protein [Silvibacterium sp.]|nr:PIN domain-containing protein [Silvibacterium sp.]
MRELAFWDSSALIPLCVDQAGTRTARRLDEQYQAVVWWATPVEIASAFARLHRMKEIDGLRLAQAHGYLLELRTQWQEMDPSPSLRDYAEALLASYSLRAADALQLAAASTWTMHRPANRPLISGDQRLLEAARQMGFRTIEI